MRASLGRRLLGITIDWMACYFIVAGFSGGLGRGSASRPFEVLALFSFEYFLLVALQGQSLGHRLLRMKVITFPSGGAITFKQSLIRTILLILIITAITYDEDGRGIHERLSQSATIRY